MNTQIAYTPTAPAAISSALNSVFASMTRQERPTHRRSANSNFIAVAGSPGALEGLDTLIDMLCLARPSRFFVTYLDEAGPRLSTEISARCHLLSKSENICSEVIRLGASKRGFAAVPGVIRANLLTGMSTEIFLQDPNVPGELVQTLLPLADQLIFDSSLFENRLDMLRAVERIPQGIVDLQWIGLAPWRDEIKNIFARQALSENLGGIARVEIAAELAPRSERPLCALLMGAWLMERLGLTARRRSGKGVMCTAADGREVEVAILSKAAGASRLAAVDFGFAGAGQGQRVRLDRTEKGLDIAIHCGERLHLWRPIDDESGTARLERYFLIGESFANYRAEFRGALALDGLGAK
jgi:glucose-6-phosphate dehydrogenase assembly protein OpcA